MALAQRKVREIVFQLIYSYDFAQNEPVDMISFLMRRFAVPKKIICRAQEKATAVCQKNPELDQKIAQSSLAYALERIPRVEKNILRLGIYELFYQKELPPKVVIAEAIRLARKYATPEGADFINAILDQLYHEREDFLKCEP